MLRVEAPAERSAEINALLARRDLFAAEIHPHEGSLEEAFLELTAAAQFHGASASALGGLPAPVPPGSGRTMPGEGKRQ